jgi:hypothetical protein
MVHASRMHHCPALPLDKEIDMDITISMDTIPAIAICVAFVLAVGLLSWVRT